MFAHPYLRWMFLLGYGFVASGVPLPGPETNRAAANGAKVSDDVVRFPCEDGSCGCSAEQCWTSCCCNSLPERLAWARKNGIKPHISAIRAAKRMGLSTDAWIVPERSAADACCSADSTSDSHETSCVVVEATNASCCETSDEDDIAANSTSKQTATNEVSHSRDDASMFSVLSAMQCRGVGDGWQGIPIGPITTPEQIIGEVVFVPALMRYLNKYASIDFEPAIPPPRFV